jgi:hypothetical protein
VSFSIQHPALSIQHLKVHHFTVWNANRIWLTLFLLVVEWASKGILFLEPIIVLGGSVVCS